MSISITFTDLTPAEAVALLNGGAPATTQAGTPMAPPTAPPMPQAPAPVPAPTPAPPPAAAPAAPAVSGKLGQCLSTMDAYVKARGATGVADAKKVLAQVQLQRPQDANEAQLDWLITAFANTQWVP